MHLCCKNYVQSEVNSHSSKSKTETKQNLSTHTSSFVKGNLYSDVLTKKYYRIIALNTFREDSILSENKGNCLKLFNILNETSFLS